MFGMDTLRSAGSVLRRNRQASAALIYGIQPDIIEPGVRGIRGYSHIARVSGCDRKQAKARTGDR
jgi:hypothetical protein